MKNSNFLNISDSISNFNEKVGKAISWLSVLLVLLFFYDVLMRYIFNYTTVWIGELEWHLFSLLFLLAGAYALKNDRHVRVDLFYQKFSPKKQAWINLIGTLFFLIPWCLAIIYASFNYANISFDQMEGSPNPGGLPYRFLIKSAITIGFVLVLMQAIANIFNSIQIIKGGNISTTSNQNN